MSRSIANNHSRQTHELGTILTATFSLLLLSPGVAAGEKNKTTYAAGMTGVMCDGCKAPVREAFSKLQGIDAKSITIEAGEKQGTQKGDVPVRFSEA